MKKLIRRKFRRSLMVGVPALASLWLAATTAKAVEMADEELLNKPAIDTLAVEQPDSIRYGTLTMADYEAVATELDIPVAAIRAVVSIEAGNKAHGFNADNKPLINFDLIMFRQIARRRGIDLNKYKGSHAVVFNRPNVKKYGSYQAAQYARLESAMTIDTVCALEGTFWGMFQIGGFNWKICGCSSVEEFVELMSVSERQQLELFAAYIKARNLVGYIRNRQWAAFASRYNGNGYKKNHYDTKMAAAYKRFTKEEQQE